MISIPTVVQNQLLSPVRYHFRVEKEGLPEILSLQAFEAEMGYTYRPHLVFHGEQIRKKVEKTVQKLRRKGELTRKQLWLGSYFCKEIEQGFCPDVTLRWLGPAIGWGVFATRSFRKGEFIGEYGGVLRKRRRADRRNSYCFQYAVTEETFLPYNIDAQDQGGITRFINHSFTPNLLTTPATFDEITHILLLTNEPIPRGAQLLYDYGSDYWEARKGLQRIDS